MKIYQITVGSIQEERIPCIESVTTLASTLGIEYHMIELPDVESGLPVDRAIVADRERINLACNESEIIYIDTDILLSDSPTFWSLLPSNEDLIMSHYCGIPDTSLFYSPNTAFWLSLLDEYQRRGIQPVYGSWRKVLRDKKVSIWPVDTYNHLMLTNKTIYQ